MNKKLIHGLKTCFICLLIAMFMFSGCSDSSTSSTTSTDTTKSGADTVKMDTANTRPIKTPD